MSISYFYHSTFEYEIRFLFSVESGHRDVSIKFFLQFLQRNLHCHHSMTNYRISTKTPVLIRRLPDILYPAL